MSVTNPEPSLLTGRFVQLEPVGRQHLEGLIASGLDPALYEWTVDRVDSPEAMAAGIENALEAMAAGREVVYATVEVRTGLITGTTRFLNVDRAHRRVEIGGTRVGLAWQRSPINTEAKFLMLRHAFEVWGMNRVEFKTDALNTRSRAAIARLGAVEEGTLRHHMIARGGRVRDSVYFAIIAPDWPAVRDRLTALLDRPWSGRVESQGSAATDPR